MLASLFPHQQRALDMLKASLRSGKRRPQLQLPTGSGKTIIAINAMASAMEKGNRVAFTVPLLTLIDQTVERLIENGIDQANIGVVQADHELRRPHAPLQVCSVQTLAKRDFPPVEFAFVDESHIQHKTIAEWMGADEKKIFIGLSATPWAKGMAKHYDDLLIPATIKDLITSGHLCPFKAFAPSKPDLSGIAIVNGDYHQDQLSALMQQKELTADVVGTWLEKAEDRPTMVFAVDRAHAAKLHDEFCGIGVRSAYVDMATPRDERTAVRELFQRGEIRVICSVGTMNAGVDLDVRCISFARPTKSPILYVQSIGRGLRTAPGKDHLLILDHSNATLSLGLVDEIYFGKLRGGERGESSGEVKRKLPGPRECPECKVLVPATVRYCECGHIFRYVSRVETRDGELVEYGKGKVGKAKAEDGHVYTGAEKADVFAQLKHYALMKGYAEGWAAHKYQDRFGVWPSGWIRDVEPRQPTRNTLAWIWMMTKASAQRWRREQEERV
jgi:superfamily II DNA or RNA helicase